MARAVRRSPELKAGWPQHACVGTATVQPASSRSLTAAKPTDGRIRSTRQVTNSATRLAGSAMRKSWLEIENRDWPKGAGPASEPTPLMRPNFGHGGKESVAFRRYRVLHGDRQM